MSNFFLIHLVISQYDSYSDVLCKMIVNDGAKTKLYQSFFLNDRLVLESLIANESIEVKSKNSNFSDDLNIVKF